ncbi:MAG: tetratricopeptide repeat protein [Candidatus Omnitrophica bacterium]|nr:tetratricopeptide repeat protein [Candidatus Omnitrophota bacterium]
MNKRILAKLVGFGLLFFVAIFNPCSSFAQGAGLTTANQFFYQGNSAYKEGKYDTAIDSYEKVASLGLESGNLYYNLGNSYFKKGELGKAVLNYERALFFIPNDSDSKSNHEYTLSFLNSGPQSFGNWFERFANRFFEEVTVNFLTILLSVVYLITILALIRNLFFDGAKRSIKILPLVLIPLFILSAVSLSRKIIYLNKGAIVISKEADVKFEPITGATTYFKLTEGSKVEILERADSWYKIKRPDGKIGWVDKTNLESLFGRPGYR